MKLLLDTCVWGGTIEALETAGHDVTWAGAWDVDPGDDEILARAHREGRILVTLDKDFGELASPQPSPRRGEGFIRRINGNSPPNPFGYPLASFSIQAQGPPHLPASSALPDFFPAKQDINDLSTRNQGRGVDSVLARRLLTSPVEEPFQAIPYHVRSFWWGVAKMRKTAYLRVPR